MTTIRLSTKESFKIPDKYEMSMMTINMPNDMNDDIIKIKCLVIEDKTTEQIKRRYYPLAHVIAFGDEIGFLP
jgi:hypothetical protein